MARKPTVTQNPLHEFIRYLTDVSVEGIPSWMDDIIMGACYTSAGSNKGKLNINPSYVRSAIFLPNISTENILSMYRLDPVNKRTAQRIAKATRFALSGIELYLSRETEQSEEAKRNAKLEKEFINSYKEGYESLLHSPLKTKVPDSISSLYFEGKYLEYTLAVRDHRSNE